MDEDEVAKKKALLAKHLKSNFSNFMAQYEAKQARLVELRAKEKDLISKNIEQKKKLIKKHSDLRNLAEGRDIENDDPFTLFLKQM